MVNATIAPNNTSFTSPKDPAPVRRVVRCDVVTTSRESHDRFATDLLPWADPYIASLMASLQRDEA